ncbi:MAG: DUF1569 domain-containing protein [Cyclobacteriaceae bacterium]|nr:DUF1569 domain-containing protein [Cyclobacteriaceae bacterium]MBX2955887.1 DUF1569 domain-containing protein [Cyclobacteriaceae bacterium]
MKNLFDRNDSQEILNRIEKLTPETQRLWGKMDVAQMLAHCSKLLRIARGLEKPRRSVLGILLGWMVKETFFGAKPHPKNSPTDKTLIVADQKIFEEEKRILTEHIKAFSEGGPERCTTHPNPFFGKLAPEEWARGQYKHLDHHLQQFGV